MSGMRVAFPNTKRTWFFDVFPSIDKVSKISSPVLVIHGTEDEVIDFSHGLSIYEKCTKAVEPLWVEGAGHNDIELYNQYLDRLKKFVSVELVNWQSKNGAPPPPQKTQQTPKSGASTSKPVPKTNEKSQLLDDKATAKNSSTTSSSVPPAPSPPKINEKLL